ncbi:uncharacterized protein LOC142817991 isoform X3 [Rhipicephalus microplus]|uniref:uncharacterized protein LOC142817991 isoform X3 n=1 Tax=Rhipicephalus microplus TaxID=6941 RepID=UPI003F6AE9BE
MTTQRMFMRVIAKSMTKRLYKNWWNSTTPQSDSHRRKIRIRVPFILLKFARVIAERTTLEAHAHQTAFAASCT